MKTVLENEHRIGHRHKEGIKRTNTCMEKKFLKIQFAEKVYHK